MIDTSSPHQINLAREASFRLGAVDVRPSAREIIIGGERETVEPRVMQVLVALQKRRGEVVSRDDLIKACWEGRIVGEDAINRCLAKVRRLTERMEGVSIETVPRVGYRLDMAASEAAQIAGPAGRRIIITIGAVLALLALIFAGHTMMGRAARPASAAFTVLPFTSLNSGEEMHLFGKAIGAATSDALNRVGLRLVSTAPLPAKVENRPTDVGAALGADYVISGSVRREGDVVRAVARVDQVEGGVTIYSRSFEVAATEMTALPDQIAAAIAGSIASPVALASHEPDAGTRAGILRAMLSEDAVVGLDAARATLAAAPRSGLANLVFALQSHAITTDPQTTQGEREALIAPARMASAKARAALPDLGDALLGECLFAASIAAQCEDRFREGMAEDPRSAYLPVHLARLLAESGRIHDARRIQSRAHSADPLNPEKAGDYLYLLLLSPGASAAEVQSLLRAGQRYWRRDPAFVAKHFQALVASGRMEQAERMLGDPVAAAIIEPPGVAQPVRAILKATRTRSPADIEAARAACLGAQMPRDVVMSVCLNGLVALHNLEAAFVLAGKSYDTASAPSRSLLFGPVVAPMRADPRFAAIARRAGLIDYWRARRMPDFCTAEATALCQKIRESWS